MALGNKRLKFSLSEAKNITVFALLKHIWSDSVWISQTFNSALLAFTQRKCKKKNHQYYNNTSCAGYLFKPINTWTYFPVILQYYWTYHYCKLYAAHQECHFDTETVRNNVIVRTWTATEDLKCKGIVQTKSGVMCVNLVWSLTWLFPKWLSAAASLLGQRHVTASC